jgi:hypothetical protein
VCDTTVSIVSYKGIQKISTQTDSFRDINDMNNLHDSVIAKILKSFKGDNF